MKEKETFLGTTTIGKSTLNHLWMITDDFLTELDDDERIEKLKSHFMKMIVSQNDKAALEFLLLIEKAYQVKERNIAEKPDGDGHLGNASLRAERQLRDWLMKNWATIPGTRRVSTGYHPNDDETRPVLTESRKWILEKITKGWEPKKWHHTERDKEHSNEVFSFMIRTFSHMSLASPPPEYNEILRLIRTNNTNFSVEELEELIQDKRIPSVIKEILAMARTKKGGVDLCLRDIHNAKIIESLD